MSLTYFARRYFIRREMNVVAAARLQALLLDGGQETLRCAVIQHLWWYKRFQPQIDVDRMSLVGTDACASGIEGEALFIVFGDDLL